jgi:signal transduction histidine kinase
MPRGGQFTVRTLSVGEQVELRFTDTGSGIPSELHERVFEPFFTYGKFQGAGLGLAIAKQIVEEHGGMIHLDSEGGKGTTFTICLPA